MSINDTRLLEELTRDLAAVDQAVNVQPELKQVVFTGNLSNAGTATLVALDALGGTMRNVKVKVWVSGATAGLGITPSWFMTSNTNPVTFVQQTVPNLGAQHALAAAAIEEYANLGDIPEGLQAEFRMASNGNDSGLTYEAYVTYEQ